MNSDPGYLGHLGVTWEDSPGLPFLLALSFLSGAVGELLELVSKQDAVMPRVFQQVPQTVVEPAEEQNSGMFQVLLERNNRS